MDELNPNHPAVIATHEHWHKLCAFLMFKNDQSKVKITTADMEAFAASENKAITVMFTDHYVELQLVGEAEAKFLARQEGLRPVLKNL